MTTIEITPIPTAIGPHTAAKNKLVEAAQNAVIDSPDRAEAGADLASVISKNIKKMEEARKTLVQPLNDHVKMINQSFKPLTDELKEAKTLIANKVGAYQAQVEEEQEAKRQAAQEAALQEAAELEQAGEAEAAESLVNAAADIKQADTTARGSVGSVSKRTRWVFDVVDVSKVPRKFLMIDEKAVNQAIRDGERHIEGLMVRQEVTHVVR